jgi:hypothetical protein
VGAALPGRPRALHLDAVGPPAPGAAVAIGLSGLAMRFVAHTDIVAVKAFMLG